MKSLAKAEQEYARVDDSGDDGYDRGAFDAAENVAARKGATQRGTAQNGGAEHAARRGRRRSRSSGTDINLGADVWATLPWRTCLRRVFDRRLDLDGDGYLTEGDLTACLPEIGVDVDSRGETDDRTSRPLWSKNALPPLQGSETMLIRFLVKYRVLMDAF